MSDSFEILLSQASENLQKCQEEKEVKSCNDCEKLLDCEIRDEYVSAVYGNMNKGGSGGFEF